MKKIDEILKLKKEIIEKQKRIAELEDNDYCHCDSPDWNFFGLGKKCKNCGKKDSAWEYYCSRA
jgi:hypothetical protein